MSNSLQGVNATGMLPSLKRFPGLAPQSPITSPEVHPVDNSGKRKPRCFFIHSSLCRFDLRTTVAPAAEQNRRVRKKTKKMVATPGRDCYFMAVADRRPCPTLIRPSRQV